MNDPVPPIPAATLILMRRGINPPELLAMERAARMAFAPGAVVFPGGRVEADDHLLAERIGGTLEHAAARITAIRETIEEVGIAAGFANHPDAAVVAELRAELRGDTPFSQLVERFGLELDLPALTPFSHWRARSNPVRRFDTLFFVAEASDDTAVPDADQSEAVHSFWASARHIIDEADADRLNLVFPTRCNLARIAQFTSIEEARAHVVDYPLHMVTAWIEERDGAEWLCIPEGIGYPLTAQRMDAVRAGWEKGLKASEEATKA